MKGMALVFQILELKVQGMGFESRDPMATPPNVKRQSQFQRMYNLLHGFG
jgi:hypothetical protein